MCMIKMTCDCGYEGKVSEFEKGETIEQRQELRNGKAALRNYGVMHYQCPGCGKEKTSEYPMDYVGLPDQDDEEAFECEECGLEITEEEYNENFGRCNACYEAEEEGEDD